MVVAARRPEAVGSTRYTSEEEWGVVPRPELDLRLLDVSDVRIYEHVKQMSGYYDAISEIAINAEGMRPPQRRRSEGREEPTCDKSSLYPNFLIETLDVRVRRMGQSCVGGVRSIVGDGINPSTVFFDGRIGAHHSPQLG